MMARRRKRSHVPALAAVVSAMACSPKPAPPATARSPSDSATRDGALWAAESLRVAALVANDTAALARIYADEFTMVTSAGEMRTKADQLREIATGVVLHPVDGAPTAPGSPGPASPQRPEDEHVLARHLYAEGTVAVVVSENTAPVVRGRDTVTARRRNTRVYVWRDARWQLVSTHISRVAEPARAR
jgi:hypothetical protein